MTDFRVLEHVAATDRGVLEAPFLDTADCRGAMSDSRVRYHAPRASWRHPRYVPVQDAPECTRRMTHATGERPAHSAGISAGTEAGGCRHSLTGPASSPGWIRGSMVSVRSRWCVRLCPVGEVTVSGPSAADNVALCGGRRPLTRHGRKVR